MKRFFSLLLILALLAACVPALAEGATIQVSAMPNEVRQFFSASQFDGWSVGAAGACAIESSMGNYYFVVAQKKGYNVLYGFEYKNENGQYNYWLKSDNCLPQGEGGFILFHTYGKHEFASGAEATYGAALEIIFFTPDSEEQGDTGLIAEVNKSGQFHVRAVFFNYLWDEAYLTSDSITYYLDEGSKIATVYGTVETNLRYFSLSAFPRTIKAAKEKLTQAPVIPSGELSAQKIKFTGGQKFPVYSGPGPEYERGANGKASVSTNDWIQVFGSENGYIMIQYAISSSQMRIGWIDQSALPKNASVSPLRFAYDDATITANTFLTDDPLNSQTRLITLYSGASVKWLSTMGSWVYVEVSGSGSKPVRGFVPMSAISKNKTKETVSASFRATDYSALANAEITYGASSTFTVTVSGPAAWNLTGADKITGYQVYANNVPLSAQTSMQQQSVSNGWSAVFTLTAAVPSGTTVIGLCPVHANTGANAGETILVYAGSAYDGK